MYAVLEGFPFHVVVLECLSATRGGRVFLSPLPHLHPSIRQAIEISSVSDLRISLLLPQHWGLQKMPSSSWNPTVNWGEKIFWQWPGPPRWVKTYEMGNASQLSRASFLRLSFTICMLLNISDSKALPLLLTSFFCFPFVVLKTPARRDPCHQGQKKRGVDATNARLRLKASLYHRASARRSKIQSLPESELVQVSFTNKTRRTSRISASPWPVSTYIRGPSGTPYIFLLPGAPEEQVGCPKTERSTQEAGSFLIFF